MSHVPKIGNVGTTNFTSLRSVVNETHDLNLRNKCIVNVSYDSTSLS